MNRLNSPQNNFEAKNEEEAAIQAAQKFSPMLRNQIIQDVRAVFPAVFHEFSEGAVGQHELLDTLLSRIAETEAYHQLADLWPDGEGGYTSEDIKCAIAVMLAMAVMQGPTPPWLE